MSLSAVQRDDSSNEEDFNDDSSIASGDKSDEESNWRGSGSGTFRLSRERLEENKSSRRLAELYPLCDSKAIPVPSQWNKLDKYKSLNVADGCLRVTYTSHVRLENEKNAGSLRSNFHIPKLCGIYYYEVTILKANNESGGCMGIGLCDKSCNLNRLPGWDQYSVGYHGDDGNCFCSTGSGFAYGPTFGTGDVIGCGINLNDRSVFFTKNGKHLGIAVRNVERIDALFPTIGMQNVGEEVEANFGKKAFKYDFEREVKKVRDRLFGDISRTPLPTEKCSWMNNIVCSWLLREGHYRALSAMSKAAKIPMEYSQEAVQNRNSIRQMILARQADRAIVKINSAFPGLLTANKKVNLYLQCQQFVEMSLRFADQASVPSSANGNSHPATTTTKHARGQKRRQESTPPPRSPSDADGHGPPARRSPHLDLASPEQMDTESGSGTSCRNGRTKNGGDVKNGRSQECKEDTTTTIEEEEPTDGLILPEDDPTVDTPRAGYTIAQAMEYEKFRTPLDFGRSIHKLSMEVDDPNEEIKDFVNHVLASICIANPAVLNSHRVLDNQQVEKVAEEVNAAILEYEGLPSVSLFHKYLTTARGIRRQLVATQSPAAPFVDIDRLVFDPTTPTLGTVGSDSGSGSRDEEDEEDVQMEEADEQ